MKQTVLGEIRENMVPDPDRWEQIKGKAKIASAHYREVIALKRRSGEETIHFAAYVTNKAMYGMHDVFCYMLADRKHWDPKVVIIPDVSRGRLFQKESYLEARVHFVERYGTEAVLDGWDREEDRYIDYTDRFDIIYFAYPYDATAARIHTIQYASERNVLPVYVNYGYDVAYNSMYARMKGPELNLVWKYFTETVFSERDLKELQIIQGENVVLTGYPKMDAYAGYAQESRGRRKKILIASHHSVKIPELPLSTFLFFYKLYPRLPELFPETDFVFRPHPLLFFELVDERIWTREQVCGYLSELKKAGVAYSDGGDYLDLFAECDAILNDCGSFTMEWLFTGKPGCFVWNGELKEEHLTTQMREAITRYTIARSAEDILHFISKVESGDACGKYEMDDWVRENIAVNYPNAAEKILEELDILKGNG